MLEIRNLSFDYSEKPLLSEINFSIAAGELLHLRGANGSGKTSLLKLIAGLIRPQQGQIFFQGMDIQQNWSHYHKQLCFVGHKAGISSLLTLREYCFFEMQLADSKQSCEKLLQRFSLEDLANMPIALLSSGQKRRAGLLRLLMTKASLWLLDEPLVSLDPQAIEILQESMEAHLQRNGCILLTSHQKMALKSVKSREYCL